jgi:TonB-linked SusC/RagA family outer membrane protein
MRRTALGLALAGTSALAASAEVTGVVVDEYGLPIASAIVTVKGSKTTLTTNTKGEFTIDGNDLIVTAPGYLSTEFNAASLRRQKDKDNIKIVLTVQNVPLETEVPTLTGTTPSESYLGSASTLYTDQLNRTIGSTVLPGMVGKMAGLNVTQSRGMGTRSTSANNSLDLAGWMPSVIGGSSISDNTMYSISSRGMSPIVYVDGIERDFYSIDPDAVESISLQKDALSTMFNGMRSSRPVLLITTKNPKDNTFRVSFTSRWGISNPINMPKALSSTQYAYLLNEALQNDGHSALYDQNDFYAFRDGTNPYLYPNVDWFDTALRNTSTSQYYNVNVTGGNDFAQYFVSAGFYYENGMFRDLNESYDTSLKSKRYSIDSKVNINVTRDFVASISLLARLQEGNQPGNYSDLLSSIYSTPNSAYPVFNPNGTYGGNYSFNNNLYARVSNSGYITDATRDLLGTLNLKYDFDRFVKGLSVYATGSVNIEEHSATTRTMQSPVYEYAVGENGEMVYNRYGTISTQTNSYTGVANYQQLYGKFGVDYDRQFGQHNLKIGVSGDTRQNINNYDLPSLPSNVLESVSYDFAKRYFAQVAVTESYYNRYAPGKRWGTFYAFGLGWDIAREKFMESTNSWLDKLKLRGVYGLTGNGVSNSGYYTYTQTYSQSFYGGYNLGSAYATTYYTYANSLANPNISWEKGKKLNLGVDAWFLNNRLQLAADYYNDTYYDLLQSRGKSIELLGTSYPSENIGRNRYRGAEIALTWQDKIGSFNYYITANWNLETSKVLFKDEQQQAYDYMVETGHSVGAMYGLIADGFFTSTEEIANSAVIEGYDNIQPGDVKYRDLNGDGVIDEFDRTVIAGDKPLHYFGLDLGCNWKGFEFSMNWQGYYNRDMYISDNTLTEGFQTQGNYYGQAYELLLGRWTPETADTAILPRLSTGGNNYNRGGGYNSSFWVKNGNFIRMKDLYVGYTLPQTFCRNFLGGVRPKLFVNVQNLCTISACNWRDPEVSFTSYPLQRTWSMGVNIKF